MGGVDGTATLAKQLYETLEGDNAIADRSGEEDLMMMRDLEENLEKKLGEMMETDHE